MMIAQIGSAPIHLSKENRKKFARRRRRVHAISEFKDDAHDDDDSARSFLHR